MSHDKSLPGSKSNFGKWCEKASFVIILLLCAELIRGLIATLIDLLMLIKCYFVT